MEKNSIVVMLCVLVVCNFLVDEVASECCGATKGKCTMISCPLCDDGEKATPYCGVGSCNLFGCNCEGGCRKSKDGRNSLEIADGFKKIDANGDAKVSLEEAKNHIQSTGRNWEQGTHIEFARMDTDLDGFLSKDEIDPVSKV